MESVLHALGLIALGLYAVCVIVMVVSFLRAPSGFEDDEGFHYTSPEPEADAPVAHHDDHPVHPHMPAPG